MAFILLILGFCHLYPGHLRIYKDWFQIIRKNKSLVRKNGIFFQIAHQTWQKKFFFLFSKNKKPIKWELYPNSFWVYLVWLFFLVVFQNINCPNPDFIPMSKFSFLKMGPNHKMGNFCQFCKILWNFCEILWNDWNFQG